jgi:uncharacterized protein YndB with AHSA1/START domain
VSLSTYEHIVHSAAPPAVVFEVVADATRWHEWAGWSVAASSWAREGDPAPGGVGAVRRLGRWPFFTSEEVTEYDPPHHLAYTITAGLPVRGYHADVDLVPTATGTTIRWSAAFEPVVVGTGAALEALLGAVVLHYARAAATEAERRHRTALTKAS